MPTYRELSAIQRDRASNSSTQSEAEKRILRTSDWITGALAKKKIVLEGLCHFTPEDGTHPVYSDTSGKIDVEYSGDWQINFAESFIGAGGSLYSMPHYPATFLGQIEYFDVCIPLETLFELLDETKGNGRLPVFQFDAVPAQNASNCVIQYGGEEVKLMGLKDKEGRHCALMALELLVRFPNQKVSPQLLSRLVCRNVNTTRPSPERRAELETINLRLNTISLDFYHGRCSIQQAHEKLAAFLSESEGRDIHNAIPNVTPRGRRKYKTPRTYSQRKADFVVNLGKFYQDLASQGGGQFVAYMEERLEIRPHYFLFRPERIV